jgi:hypothetical protein
MPTDGSEIATIERRSILILAGDSGLIDAEPSAAISTDVGVHCAAASMQSGWGK